MGAIAGFYNLQENNNLLEKMAHSLRYRLNEPEIYQDSHVAFFQEKTTTNIQWKNYAVVLDGNIYNWLELKEKYLINAGDQVSFLIELYKLKGNEGFSLLEGSFCFSIWDKNEKKLTLVRDHLGEKAVYYWSKSGRFIFASEIKAILEGPDVHREVNLGSLEKYFTFSYVPGAETMIKDIYELLPAHYLTVDSGNISLNQYWDVISAVENTEGPKSENEMIEDLRCLLEESVRKRLPLDNQPVGSFLSGGIDSSLVSAIAQKFRKTPINTYSIHFGKKYPNELYYSSMVANHLKSNHKIIEVKPKNFLEEMYHIIWCLDDPIGDPITVPNFIMAREAKKDVSVILNGEGGDPCFGGPKNIPMMLSQLYSTGAESSSLEKYYLKSYKKCYDDLPVMLSENIQNRLKSEYQPMEEFISAYLHKYPLKSFLDKLMYLNIKLKGTHQILVKVDKMTSANHLAARAPLFSPGVAGFSFKIPANLKLNGRVEKYLLKKAVEDILPLEVVYREKKGMMVPVKYWFEQDLKKYASRVLSPKNIKEKGYFNPEFIKNLINYKLESPYKSHMGLKLWMLLTFEIWHQVFIDKGSSQ
jgi:asparagine synthase (glutamine-hydrolysing)